MKIKESILSAYLDGELDSETRNRVDLAAQTHPRIASRLAELSQIRQVVASLSRPTLGVNLASEVVNRISRDRQARIRRSQRLLFASCAMAAAACVMIVTLRPTLVTEPSNLVANVAIRPMLAPPQPPGRRIPKVESRSSPAVAKVSTAIPSEVLATELENRRDLMRYRDLVAGNEVKEMLVEVDTLGSDTIDRVEEAIHKSNRRIPEHARLRLYHEVAPDPNHPGEVAVYVLVMDDVERNLFAQNLEQSLPRSTSPDKPSETTLVARLPDSRHLELRGGLPRGTLLPPPPHLVNQDAFRDAPFPDLTAGQTMTAAINKTARSKHSSGPEERPTGVYVVWVTKRDGPRSRTN